MKQIIAFIAPLTFVTLLDCSSSVGFSQRPERRNEILGNGNHVFYMDGKDEPNSSFAQARAEGAQCLLVPDTLAVFDDYVPVSEFVVLSHDRTPERRYAHLKASPLFRGHRTDNEIPRSTYDAIARQICGKEICLEAVWEKITRLYGLQAKSNYSISQASDETGNF